MIFEIGWHRWEQPVLAVCGVVPVATLVPVLTAGIHRHYRGTTTNNGGGDGGGGGGDGRGVFEAPGDGLFWGSRGVGGGREKRLNSTLSRKLRTIGNLRRYPSDPSIFVHNGVTPCIFT